MGRLLSKSIKTIKSDNAKFGYLTRILYLAPHKLSGKNICPHASPGCVASCLNKSGMGFFPKIQRYRLEKTKFYLERKDEFIERLYWELSLFVKYCERKNKKPAVRLNGTSDIPWESYSSLFSLPIQYYDYTKNPRRMKKYLAGELPPNYHLTFSRSETNGEDVKEILKLGGNVSVVFYRALPPKYLRRKVNDGDLTDLRFLDPKGIIGLRAKGVGRSDVAGFVVR